LFGTISGSGYVTGPTGISELNGRADATVSRTDGFRDLASRDEEIRPALEWTLNNHKINFSLDARNIHETPDSYDGLIYFHGTAITNVPMMVAPGAALCTAAPWHAAPATPCALPPPAS
jgi:iron complex outermembrane recepter protein